MAEVRVLAFAGSIRKESFNRKLLKASIELKPEGMEIEVFDISSIPAYNMDLEPDFPESVVAFKERIKAADGLLIATPEHNYSYPGILKNAIDWASRPPAEAVFDNKPVAVQSASTGWSGGLRAQINLQQVLAYFPMRQMYFPQVCVGNAKDKFDEDGNLTDERSRGNIEKQLAKFLEFISG